MRHRLKFKLLSMFLAPKCNGRRCSLSFGQRCDSFSSNKSYCSADDRRRPWNGQRKSTFWGCNAAAGTAQPFGGFRFRDGTATDYFDAPATTATPTADARAAAAAVAAAVAAATATAAAAAGATTTAATPTAAYALATTDATRTTAFLRGNEKNLWCFGPLIGVTFAGFRAAKSLPGSNGSRASKSPIESGGIQMDRGSKLVPCFLL